METVLIVEDEVKARDALIDLLRKDGREIVTAGDGQEAMECLAKGARPRVILLDLMMPRMDGWEFLRRQSADPSIARIPTIVLSGSERAAGAKHQLSKSEGRRFWATALFAVASDDGKKHQEAIARVVHGNHFDIGAVPRLRTFPSTNRPYPGESGLLEVGQEIR
jgi:CheY-like chemotaxis protein